MIMTVRFYVLAIATFVIMNIFPSFAISTDEALQHPYISDDDKKMLVPNKAEEVTLVHGKPLQFQLSYYPNSTSFVLFHVHTQYATVILSLTANWIHGKSTRGNNVGIVSIMGKDAFLWYVSSNAKEDVRLLVVANPYPQNYPIPGGCNMEFPLENDPNLLLNYNSYQSYVAFEYAANSIQNLHQCETALNTQLNYYVFQYFMKEGSIDPDDYFNTIKHFFSAESIEKKATKVATYNSKRTHTNVSFASFPRQGTLYAVIVEQINSGEITRAPYVPIITYTCDFQDKSEPYCSSERNYGLQVVATLVGAVGLFVCFFGHRFFKTSMFYFGFLACGLLCYIIIMRFSSIEEGVLIGVVLILAGIGGALWWTFWAFVGIPVLAVLLPGLVLGYLCTSIIFNLSPLGWLPTLQVSLTYGMSFLFGTLVIPLILLCFAKQLNILACAIVGSYALILAVDTFLYTNVEQILFLSIKKGSVEDFIKSITRMPFQVGDAALVVAWIILFMAGIAFQCWREKGRPAFPPHPYGQYKLTQNRARRPGGRAADGEDLINERRPLLPGSSSPQYHSGVSQPPLFDQPFRSSTVYPTAPPPNWDGTDGSTRAQIHSQGQPRYGGGPQIQYSPPQHGHVQEPHYTGL